MENATFITPLQAAEAAGLTVYEFDGVLRDQAALRLENLASRIRRGHEADEDVDLADYDEIVAGVRRQVESAHVLTVLTVHWVAEVRAEMAEAETDS